MLARRCLQDNALTDLPPMVGFASLTRLNLSFNRLGVPVADARASGVTSKSVVAALAPLALLRSLQLNDTPLTAAGAGYSAAVAAALPWLCELDLEPISSGERQRRLAAAARQGRLPLGWHSDTGWRLASPAAGEAAQHQWQQPAAAAAGGDATHWEAQSIMWCLSSASLAAVSTTLAQQGSLQGHCAPPVGCGQGSSSWDALAALAGLPAAGPLPRGDAAEQLQQQYALLLTAELPRALQGLLAVNAGYYHEALAVLSRPAVAIQSAWRGFAARRLCRRLAAERLARQVSWAPHWLCLAGPCVMSRQYSLFTSLMAPLPA